MSAAAFSRALLAAGLAAVVLAGLPRVASVAVPSHDDAIAYLAATGHQMAYEANRPADAWVRAEAWQALWTPDGFGTFRRISADLGRTDLHPPLYFWLLHGWVHLVGTPAWAGPALNLLLLLLAVVVLAQAAQAAGARPEVAVAAALVWALSGAALAVLVEARPYLLLALASAAFLWALLAWLRRPTTGRTALALGLASLAGLLTHYHFVFVLAGGALVALRARPDGRRLRTLFLGGLAVGAACWWLHPHAFASITRQQGWVAPFSLAEVPLRAGLLARGLFDLVLPVPASRALAALTPAVGAGVGALGLALLGVAAVRLRRRAADSRRTLQPERTVPGVLFLLTMGGVGAAFLLGLSPRHAMGAKYTAVAAPLLYAAAAAGLGVLLPETEAARRRVLIALVGLQALAALVVPPPASRTPLDAPLTAGHPVVLDTDQRGYLPPLLWSIPPKTPVFATSREALAAAPPAPPPGADTLIYLAVPAPGNEPAARDTLLARWQRQGLSASPMAQSASGTVAWRLVRESVPAQPR